MTTSIGCASGSGTCRSRTFTSFRIPIGRDLTRRFRDSQTGTISRALTVDDGLSAVTPNYLKIRLNERHPRNEWISVRIEGGEPLAASVV